MNRRKGNGTAAPHRYEFDENKEKITNLREKYAQLHNKLEYRMDVLGPWMNKSLWEHQDHASKYKEFRGSILEMLYSLVFLK